MGLTGTCRTSTNLSQSNSANAKDADDGLKGHFRARPGLILLVAAFMLLVVSFRATAQPRPRIIFTGNTTVDIAIPGGSSDLTTLAIYRDNSPVFTIPSGYNDVYRDSGVPQGRAVTYELRSFREGQQTGSTNIGSTTPGEVGGSLRKSMTWEGGPWVLHANITIEPGATLTLNSAEVATADNRSFFAFDVQGRLLIENSTLAGKAPSSEFGALYINIDADLDEQHRNAFISVKNSTLNFLSIRSSVPTVLESLQGGQSVLIRLDLQGRDYSFSRHNLPGATVRLENPSNVTVEQNIVNTLLVGTRSPTAASQVGKIIIRNNTRGEILGNHVEVYGLSTSAEFQFEGNTFSSLILTDIANELPGVAAPGTLKRFIRKNNLDYLPLDMSHAVVEGNTIAQKEEGGGIFSNTGLSVFGDYNLIKNNTFTGDGCLIIDRSEGNEIVGNVIEERTCGIWLRDGTRNMIHGNTFARNQDFNIRLEVVDQGPKDNLIFDNIFIFEETSTFSGLGFRPGRVQFDLDCTPENCSNTWSQPKRSETNVLGGPFIGGNYWSDYTGRDADGDGIGETPHVLNEFNVDPLPLIAPDLVLLPGTTNPDNELANLQQQPVRVAQILVRSFAKEGPVQIESMTFRFAGTGLAGHAQRLGLFRDAGCSGASEAGLQGGTFSGGSVTFSGLTETIQPLRAACYLVKYQLQPACACSSYGATISPEFIRASLNGRPIQMGGKLVTGTVRPGYPDIDIIGNDKPFGKKNKKLDEPLSIALLQPPPNECPAGKWQAHYELRTAPAGAAGQKFDSGSSESSVPFDVNNQAQAVFFVGSKAGLYEALVRPELVPGSTLSCPSGAVNSSEALYSIFVAGLDLQAQHDGAPNNDELRTFISNIETSNTLTAVPVLAAGDARSFQQVTFNLAGESQTDDAAPFAATFDMAKVSGADTLTLSGTLSDGSTVEEQYPVYAIPFPAWLNVVQQIQTFIGWEFEDEAERYRFNFTYPGDFIWSNPIPSSIPIIGAKENEAALSCMITANYLITQDSDFAGRCVVDTEIFGNPFQANGEVIAAFDPDFKLKPGAQGTLQASIDFSLPERRLASKTIIVYGIPITLAVDLGGNVQIFVNGIAILDQQFNFEKVTFVPGTTITLDLTATASAVFGAAKIGVRGSPSGTLKIKLSYRSADRRVTQEQFGGELEVALTVFGSLFWGTVSGDLGSTVLGPYTFGDEVAASGLRVKRFKAQRALQAARKNFYSTASIASNLVRQRLQVRTVDTAQREDEVNPEIAVRTGTSTGWGSEVLITNNQLWELDPAATYLADNSALAVWTSNKGVKTLTKLNDIFANQDIAYAYFDGSSWSPEARIIDDAESDGSAAVAYDSVSRKAVALWVHNRNTSENLMDRSQWSIFFSLFDEATRSWSEPAAIPGTDDGAAADFLPSVASDHRGGFLAVWVRDEDGAFFTSRDAVTNGSDTDATNSDNDLYYSVYNGTSWTPPKRLTPSNEQTDTMPNVGGSLFVNDPAVVWVRKNGTSDQLLFSRYTPGADTWSSEEVLDTGSYLIENPQLVIDRGNKASIIYRKHTGRDDAVFVLEKDLSASLQTVKANSTGTPRRLTFDGAGALWPSIAITNRSEVITSWTNVQPVTAGPGDVGLRTSQLDASEKARLLHSYSARGVDSGGEGEAQFLTALEVTADIEVLRQGSYALRARLRDGDGNLIAEAQGESQQLAPGMQRLSLSFSGREISAAKQDGPYRVADIVLLDTSQSPIGIAQDSEGFTTDPFSRNEFIASKLTLDRAVYEGEDATMTVRVADSQASGTVEVEVTSSATADPLLMSLVESDEPGIFSGEVRFSSSGGRADGTATMVRVEEAAIVKLTYIDDTGKEWLATAAWRQKPPVVHGVRVAVDPSFAGSVSATGGAGLSCPGDCFESFRAGSAVTLRALPKPGFVFAGWEGGGCGADPACPLTVNEETRLTAAFSFEEIGPLKIGIVSNQNAYAAGDVLALSISVTNPTAASQLVDAFLGLILPDGGVLFFDETLTGFRPGSLQDPRSFTPIRTGLQISPGFNLPATSFFHARLPGTLSAGAYLAFAAFAESGSAQAGAPLVRGQISIAPFTFAIQ